MVKIDDSLSKYLVIFPGRELVFLLSLRLGCLVRYSVSSVMKKDPSLFENAIPSVRMIVSYNCFQFL